DSILTFGKDGLTGHMDHCQVSQWTKEAVQNSGTKAAVYHAIQTADQYKAMRVVDKKFNIFFNIDKPPLREPAACAICIDLNDDLYNLKIRALEAMPSQFEAILKAFEPTLRLSFGSEAFVEAA